MSEIAIRKDGTQVKIGSCEEMMYLRFEDRTEVKKMANNVDPVAEAHHLRFRLPYPDEDGIRIGEYEDYFRGLRLYRGNENFTDDSKATEEHKGSIQMSHKCGLLFSVPCYHGAKLPEIAGSKVFWNGKSWFFELASIRCDRQDGKLKLWPVVKCRFCQEQWRYDWSTVLEYVPAGTLRDRLEAYSKYEFPAPMRRAAAPMVGHRLQDDDRRHYSIEEITGNAFRVTYKGTPAWYMFENVEQIEDTPIITWAVKASIK